MPYLNKKLTLFISKPGLQTCSYAFLRSIPATRFVSTPFLKSPGERLWFPFRPQPRRLIQEDSYRLWCKKIAGPFNRSEFKQLFFLYVFAYKGREQGFPDPRIVFVHYLVKTECFDVVGPLNSSADAKPQIGPFRIAEVFAYFVAKAEGRCFLFISQLKCAPGANRIGSGKIHRVRRLAGGQFGERHLMEQGIAFQNLHTGAYPQQLGREYVPVFPHDQQGLAFFDYKLAGIRRQEGQDQVVILIREGTEEGVGLNSRVIIEGGGNGNRAAFRLFISL